MGRPRILELLFLKERYESEKALNTKSKNNRGTAVKDYGLYTIDEIERLRGQNNEQASQIGLIITEPAHISKYEILYRLESYIPGEPCAMLRT